MSARATGVKDRSGCADGTAAESGSGACDRVPVACVLAGEHKSEAPDELLVGGLCSAGGDRILDRVPAGHLTSSAAGIAPPKRSTLQSAFAQSGYISTTSCVVS